MAGRQDYAERRQDRIDRMNDKAYAAGKEADAHRKRADNISRRFEMGQPILIGHHSEAGARSDQKRMHVAMERSLEASEKARHYAGRAAAAENNTAISSDNPDAPERLEAKIAELEKKQAEMKAINAYWRKHGTMKGFPGMSDKRAVDIDELMKTAYSWVQEKGPYEDWKLKNNNATIRAAKKRLEEIAGVEQMAAEIIKFNGGEIDSNADTNRVIIRFDERQGDEMTAQLKRNGFKWSPTSFGWQRLRNPRALEVAKRICGIA